MLFLLSLERPNCLDMRHLFFSLIFSLFFSLVSAQDTTRLYKYSDMFIRHFSGGAYDKAVEMFDDKMGGLVSKEQLRDLWSSIENQYGKYQDTGETYLVKAGEHHVVITTMNFNKLPIYLKLSFDPAYRIAGLFYEPAQRKDAYKKPSYAAYERIKEYKTKLVSGPYELPAILTLPKGQAPFPVVILVHGSGPNDMDETLGPNKPFKDLALGLATKGVAVFRYDKRSHVYGAGSKGDTLTLHEEVVEDAVAAVDFVKTFPEVDTNRIYVAGHSLGAMMAPEIASQSREVEGIVLLAAPTRSLLTIIGIQVDNILKKAQQNNDTAMVSRISMMKEQLALAQSDTLSLSVSPEKLPYSVPASYWLSTRQYDQKATVRRLDESVLILHAEKDQQVFMEDFQAWKKEFSDSEKVDLKLYPGLNHLFLESKKEEMAEDYELQGNVEEEVISDIAGWILTGQLPAN